MFALVAILSFLGQIIYFLKVKIFCKNIFNFLTILGSIDAIQIFSNEPLSSEQPVWKSQSHSLQPTDLWSPELKNLPKPTNAWWQNLGK